MPSCARVSRDGTKEEPNMMKKVIALVLCFVLLLPCFAACSHGEEDKGAYIRMYLSEPIYNFDPLVAFHNADAMQIVELLFEGLFEADEDGDPKKALVDKYDYIVDEEEGTYTLEVYFNGGLADEQTFTVK